MNNNNNHNNNWNKKAIRIIVNLKNNKLRKKIMKNKNYKIIILFKQINNRHQFY